MKRTIWIFASILLIANTVAVTWLVLDRIHTKQASSDGIQKISDSTLPESGKTESPNVEPPQAVPISSTNQKPERANKSPEKKANNTLKSRIRIVRMSVIPPMLNEYKASLVNLSYDNGGTVPANSIAVHYIVHVTPGELASDSISEVQDQTMNWDGWSAELKKHSLLELYPGDPPQVSTFPSEITEQTVADMTKNFENFSKDRKFLYIFVAIKFRDKSMPAGKAGMTEACFWYSASSIGNFIQHLCGRHQSLLVDQN